ncbi:MAG: hypothetical protein MUF54_09260 [Polyangiaceae bacterium]|nr:hypothetical protein [Polyangiaceae bacterium]
MLRREVFEQRRQKSFGGHADAERVAWEYIVERFERAAHRSVGAALVADERDRTEEAVDRSACRVGR